jgi:hypothetical protein
VSKGNSKIAPVATKLSVHRVSCASFFLGVALARRVGILYKMSLEVVIGVNKYN